MGLLVAGFLVTFVPAWANDTDRRAIKRPKPLVTDSGLLCSLLKTSEQRLLTDRDAMGPVLESFVALELLRQCGWSDARAQLHHYRTDAHEVDIVLEDASGRVVGVEVTATT